MRRIFVVSAVFCGLLGATQAKASPIGDLQHLLDNAGYNVSGETGKWTKGTASALAGFAAQYGIDAGDKSKAPDDAAVPAITAAAKARLDAEYATFPTKPLPDGYFVGLGDANYFDINTWSSQATALRDGKKALVAIKRYYEPLDDDIARFKASGVKVIRAQLGMDGALFFDECHYRQGGDNGQLDACYGKAYVDASASKWAKQIELLDHFSDNPVVKLYADSVAKWNEQGFHVIVVPTDFFNGAGSHFNGSDDPEAAANPLFHRALMNDAVFQAFYPRFVAAVIGEFKKRNITNFSVQSANEPRFCGRDGSPTATGLKTWQAEERAVIDAIRRIAPRVSFVSTAVCTAGVMFFSSGHPYSDLGKIMPWHADMDGVSYAFHLYTPSALFAGAAQNGQYRPGTLFHYPFKPIPASAAINHEATYSVRDYNRAKLGLPYFRKMFGDIAAFAKKRGIRVMITETGIPKPQYGIPREDRVAALRDLIDSTRQAGISLFYFAIVGQWGLSSCPDSVSVPDHRFDPALLNVIAWGNGVPGAAPGAPPEPLEVQCGPAVQVQP